MKKTIQNINHGIKPSESKKSLGFFILKTKMRTQINCRNKTC